MTIDASPGLDLSLITPGPDLMRGVTAIRDAHEHYCTADQYYDGEMPEKFASARFRRALARSGVSAKFNFAKTPVDALVDRLEIASVTSSDTSVAQVIADLWEDNQLDLEAPQIHRNAGKHGDAYVIVWPLNELGDMTEGDDPTPIRVGIFYNDATTTRVIYDSENPLVKSYAIKRWKTEDDRWRVDLYYPHHIEQWITKPKAKGDKAGDFIPFVNSWAIDENGIEHPDWPLENPFGEIPVFHFRNDRQYGHPEHEGFYGAQDAITKLIMAHLAVVDYQSFPQRVALADGSTDSSEAAEIDEDEFAFEIEGASGASSTGNRGGEARSSFTSDPGSVWWMQGVKNVVEFRAADPAVFFDPMAQYLRFGAQICTTPLRMFDYENAQLPSGASQSQADGPFVKKVRNRQLAYGGTWQDVFVFALTVIGYVEPDVQVNWAPAHSAEGTEALEIAGLKAALGVPKRQVLLELGYAQELVDEWFPENAPPAPVPPPPGDPQD